MELEKEEVLKVSKGTFRDDDEENIKPWMAMGRKVTRRKQCQMQK